MKINKRGKDYFIGNEFSSLNLRPFLLTLDDLYVTVYSPSPKVVPLNQSEVYKCLEKLEESRYSKYHNHVRENYNAGDVHTWQKYMELSQDIFFEGYNHQRPILVKYEDKKYVIIDGQHRAAILLMLGYDEDLQVLRT